MSRHQIKNRQVSGNACIGQESPFPGSSARLSTAIGPTGARPTAVGKTPSSTVEQQVFWNDWNSGIWKTGRGEISRRQAAIVLEWLKASDQPGRRILEVGCGSGWFCPSLAGFGDVVGTDLSDEILERAQERWPEVRFLSGDFLTLPLAPNSFDVVVTLEVLSHVPDQDNFLRKIATLLKPNGILMLATQNGPVLRDHCIIPAPSPGQFRRWVDRNELAALVEPYFVIDELFSVTPTAHRGARRLLTSAKVNALLRPVIGNLLANVLEARDWGWTLMLKARKRKE